MREAPRWLQRLNPAADWRRRRAKMAESEKKPSKVMKPRTYRPIHLATLIVLTVGALTVTGLAAWLMWDAAQVPAGFPNSPDLAVRTAQLRVDVIRNILAVGAGTGGLVALFLALRRQYVKERVDHADQEHKTRTAEDSRHDAAERRVTDLYVKAAEQLGSDKAAVRLAALYSLERVGQDNPEHRQTIVDLICAYLRMPYSVPKEERMAYVDLATGSNAEEEKRHHEHEVRLAAQRILTKHLTYSGFIGKGQWRRASGLSPFWTGMQVDLSGAVLTDFSFTKCAVDYISLMGARLRGRSSFKRMYSKDVANFSRVRFGDSTDFSDAIFDVFLCGGAEFHGVANFHGTQLGMCAFRGATFHGVAMFREARALVNDLDGAKARLSISDRHVFPKGFVLVEDDADDGYGTVVKATDPDDKLERDWWEDAPEEETEPGPVVPRQSTGHDPVDPQSAPNAER